MLVCDQLSPVNNPLFQLQCIYGKMHFIELFFAGLVADRLLICSCPPPPPAFDPLSYTSSPPTPHHILTSSHPHLLHLLISSHPHPHLLHLTSSPPTPPHLLHLTSSPPTLALYLDSIPQWGGAYSFTSSHPHLPTLSFSVRCFAKELFIHFGLNHQRRVRIEEFPLQLQNRFLYELGHNHPTHIQLEGIKTDLAPLFKFVAGEPLAL